MRVLLLHPDDSPRRGPWTRQRWDLIIDLGKSSAFSAESWEQSCGCPVWRADAFRHSVADVARARSILSAGRGRLVDDEGIDWWDLTFFIFEPEILWAPALQQIAAEINPAAELWVTRASWPATFLSVLLNRTVRAFGENGLARAVASTMRYVGLMRRLRATQIKEIVLDKYDPRLQWRAHFASQPKPFARPVVLVPSAYVNVSRVANAYARLLPEQSFLLVATRESGKRFIPSSNVYVRDLAAYAKDGPPTVEIARLVERWKKVKEELCSAAELRALFQSGLLNSFSGWLRNGISVRNAWREVIAREPVCGVLCGDDSNLYTTLPVILAARREIPSVDFHHGALDGRYLLKHLRSDLYLAKNEMERDYLVRICGMPPEKVQTAGPRPEEGLESNRSLGAEMTSIIFFSEPYESAGMRGEEVYAEILPRLCRVAREHGRKVAVKLHPFESRAQRHRILRELLPTQEYDRIVLIEGALTKDLLSQAWFGITVESSTVVDCFQNGVPCFLCGWLRLAPYGYVEQYERFGIGEVLQNAEQILEAPTRLKRFHDRSSPPAIPSQPVDPTQLRHWLIAGERPGARAS